MFKFEFDEKLLELLRQFVHSKLVFANLDL